MDGACQARQRAAGRYQRRRPNQSVLYRCIQEHLETWLAHRREGRDDDGPAPAQVEQEFPPLPGMRNPCAWLCPSAMRAVRA